MTTNNNIKSRLNKKVSFALLSGALALQSGALIERWASLPEHGENVAVDEHGNTALHIAVQNSWPEAAEILLSKGASLESINYDNFSVTTLAHNVYRDYEDKVIQANSYSEKIALADDITSRFSKAKQVIDILDKYKYADNI